MFARARPSEIQTPPAPSPAPFPAWARTKLTPETQAEAAFLAGAALARLDLLIRENPPWAGAFRRRLALAAAVASVARAGRSEDDAVLRDAFHLTRPGVDPGPAGRHLLAWRALTSSSAGQWRAAIAVAAEALEVRRDEALQTAMALIAKFVEIGYTSDRGRGLGRRGWNWGNSRSGFRVCRA
jgi:hypothetical protein